jgi:hypothetical protein
MKVKRGGRGKNRTLELSKSWNLIISLENISVFSELYIIEYFIMSTIKTSLNNLKMRVIFKIKNDTK